ncbi:hypothetical protein [Dactylosporangium salmoneum]|uniref:Right handed beta helix domain-containing protein n=1 Tax=Dactylosporangium salmoneum TaxID=53361 RepID=A0ABP5TWH0_9ACTN
MRNQSRLARHVLVAVAVGIGLAAAPATQALANPACGSVITSSVTLTSDLNCTGNALIVGAAGITVDLGGYNVIGTGTGTGVQVGSYANDVTVTNGGISGFATGVFVTASKRAILSNLAVQNGVGIKVQNGNDTHVNGGSVTSGSVQVALSTGVQFNGVALDHAPLTATSSNSFLFDLGSATDGSVSISQSNTVKLTNSTFTRAPIAYSSTSQGGLFQNDTIQGAGVGLVIDPTGFGAQILGNTFSGNGIGVKTRVSDLATITGTNISGNNFTGNTAAGVLFEVSATTSTSVATVSGNTFDGNGFTGGVSDRLGRPVADGLHFATVSGAKVTVKNNTALNNASYGVFADAGSVIDGGGNTSTGDPSGCAGVTC